MGNYNPNTPVILGNEWVDIRQRNYHSETTSEIGYTLAIDHTATVVTGYYYISEPPAQPVAQVAEVLAVYAAGTENDAGDVNEVIIPINGVTVSGAGVAPTNATVASLLYAADQSVVIFNPTPASTSYLVMQFAVNQYQQQLQGKRILDVALLYSISGGQEALDNLGIIIHTADNVSAGSIDKEITIASGLIGPRFFGFVSEIQAASIGSLNPFSGTIFLDADRTPNIYPWRWEELNQFDVSTPRASKICLSIRNSMPAGVDNPLMMYAALRVRYCDERRLLYGAERIAQESPYDSSYRPGPRAVMLRTPAFAAGAALPPGKYTVTHFHENLTEPSGVFSLLAPPEMYALQESYGLPGQVAKRVLQGTEVDDVFTVEDTDYLPQITLHTASAIVTGSHGYGTQVNAPIYGSVTAVQSLSANGASGGSYPQVRFYARRYGDTRIPLTLSGAGTSVTITPQQFDDLPEIIDGWKEVVLRLPSPPSAAGVAGNWTFSATNEAAGSRWEILGANGISLGGAHAINTTTYLSPTGGTQQLTWQSPAITGTAADGTADLALIFSQDPPTLSGFTVTQARQALITAAAECGVANKCIPTEIAYNQVSWSALAACDAMTRRALDTWDGADTGQTWTNVGGAAADYDKANGIATHTHPAVNTRHTSFINVASPNQYITGRIQAPAIATGGPIYTSIVGRYTDTSNYYFIELTLNTTGRLDLRLNKNVAGVMTNIAAISNFSGYIALQWYNVVFKLSGSQISVRAWVDGDEDPVEWQILNVDTSLTTGNNAGYTSILDSTNTNTLPVVFGFGAFTATPAEYAGGVLELQRLGTVDAVWQTILETSSFCVTGFADYEARVGIVNSYRGRIRNVYDFAGSWSVTGTGTIPAPGVTVGGDANGVLIFTSNHQPRSNLAYTMGWEGKPVEAFAFPEADTQTFLRLYGRDFQVAFRPLERGGESFDRVILVNAAAIPLESLADFGNLRDLAWADLPYVCVRDELGNRWYANVLVPAGTVQRNRTIYLAQIRVTEVTNTPAPVA